MIVLINFIFTSKPVKYKNVKNVYTKDGLLCLCFNDTENIIKFPLMHIFSIESNYKESDKENDND